MQKSSSWFGKVKSALIGTPALAGINTCGPLGRQEPALQLICDAGVDNAKS